MTATRCPWCGKGRLRVMPWPGVLQCDACRVGTVAPDGEMRIGCAVPGCRRTTKADRLDGWVCADHWTTVPRDLRRLYTAAKRRARRSMEMRWSLVAMRVWRQCRDAAIDRAMGIK